MVKILPIPKRLKRKLGEYLNKPGDSFMEKREKLILSLFYYQGFKTWMIRELRNRDYDRKNQLLKFPLTRELSKYGVIALERQTVLHLDSLVGFFIFPESPLIKSLKIDNPIDQPLGNRQIQRIVRGTMRKLGFSINFPPRQLRHCAAIELVKQNLRHKSLDKLIGRSSGRIFTQYKKVVGSFNKRGSI